MERTLWCLNRAADLIQGNEEAFRNKYAGRLNLADRTRFNKGYKPTEGDIAYNLMPSIEYFVPAVPKCIGSRFNNVLANPMMYPELDLIHDLYVNHYKQPDYTYYWDGGSKANDDCFMATADYMGYYEILEKTAPNILVGYSQGGLVARFLAYLDQCVFNKGADNRVIDAIVTISSPISGSPLANPANKSNILSAFKDLLRCIHISILSDSSDSIEKRADDDLAALPADERLQQISIQKELIYIRNLLQKICPDSAKELINVLNTWIACINWLGGLENQPNTAFFDLSIGKLDDQMSVLHCVNTPLRLPQKAILSTNNDARHLLDDTSAYVIAHSRQHLANWLHRSTGPLSWQAVEDDFIQSYSGPANTFSPIKIDYDRINAIFMDQIMVENISEPWENPLIDERIRQYENGIGEIDINRCAHDFIIPSSYQLFEQKPLPTYNQPNPLANHRTGASYSYDAGKKNYTLITDFLDDFLQHNQ
ncbi:hypothetical protein GTO89_02535 [Heliobacterium gestii]|uniref:Uncharacterized protein n=1 Tax=Heliomicrobium gestii TaxID=2699 RepID=A0A845LAF3_HELGE|nr:hypothetical protein [Heliomicrobium gestii]MBM7865660.1 hypothetical protein [Heliomicrobium gestii]MZP41910.1 hypothetical protein [Heliomicrobium gestii]